VAVNYKRRRVRVQLGAALINIWLPYEEVEELRP
jgi:hypothetical protein